MELTNLISTSDTVDIYKVGNMAVKLFKEGTAKTAALYEACLLYTSNPNRVIRLKRLGITEIDELSDAIELLSQKVSDSASRLSKILELTGVDVAAFEYDRKAGIVYVTDHFFDILALQPENDSHSLTDAELERLFHPLIDRAEEADPQSGTYVFRVGPDYAPRWIRLKVVEGSERNLGVVTDITAEITEKRKIEHDRDYDLLTNIYNLSLIHIWWGRARRDWRA